MLSQEGKYSKNVDYKIFHCEPSYGSCSSNNSTKIPLTGHCYPGRSNSENLSQEEITTQNSQDTSKSLPNVNVRKSGNNHY